MLSPFRPDLFFVTVELELYIQTDVWAKSVFTKMLIVNLASYIVSACALLFVFFLLEYCFHSCVEY